VSFLCQNFAKILDFPKVSIVNETPDLKGLKPLKKNAKYPI
jgi:hypothetical protein